MVTIKGKELVRSNGRTPNERVEAAIDFGKHHAFTIVVIVAGLATILALYTPGQATKSLSTYDDWLQFIVGLYNLVIMTWPLYLAVTTRHQMGLRLAVIGFSIVFTFFVLAFWVRLIDLAGMAATAWSIPFVGSIVLPLLAVASHGFTAILLSYVPAKDTITNSSELDELAEDLRSVQRKEARASNESAAAQSILDQDQAETDRLTQETDRLLKLKQRADEAIQQLQPSTDKQKLAEELNRANATIGVLSSEKGHDKNPYLQQLLARKERLESEIENLEHQITLTPEYSARKASLPPLEAASKRSQAAADKEQRSRKVAEEATETLRLATEERTTLEARQQAVLDQQAASKAEQKRTWRDAAIWPIVFLSVAILLYPLWYGWISATS